MATYYLKNTTGSTVTVNDLGISLPDDESLVIDSNNINGWLTTDLTAALNLPSLILSTTDIGDNGGDMSAADAIAALSITSEIDRDNPHRVTATQALSQDTTTSVTTTQLNELTDGSDTTLHIHDNRYYTKTDLQSDNSPTVAIHWGNITDAPAFGSVHWQPPVRALAIDKGDTTDMQAFTAIEGHYWWNTDDDHLHRFDGVDWIDTGAPTEGDRFIWWDGAGHDDYIYEFDGDNWVGVTEPVNNYAVIVDDYFGKAAQFIYDDTMTSPPNWIKLADVTWGDHNSLGGRSDADAHPATSISYDDTISGLGATTVQAAIEELATGHGVDIDNIVFVATNGSDTPPASGADLGTLANPFATIQAAHDDITGNTATNRYLIYVMPGTYTENVELSKNYVYLSGVDKYAVRLTSSSGDTLTLSNSTDNATGVSDITVTTTSSETADNAINITGNNPKLYNVNVEALSGSRALIVTGAHNQSIRESKLTGPVRIEAGVIEFYDSKVVNAKTTVLGGTFRVHNGEFGYTGGHAIDQEGGTVYLVSAKLSSATTSNDYNQQGGTVYWGWVEYNPSKTLFDGTKTLLFPSSDLYYNSTGNTNITSTNVGDVIDQLETFITNILGDLDDLDDHVNDTDNPHEVTFTQAALADPATNITATEAETLRDGSNADALHIHSAGAITVNDTPLNITAANVQAAIAALDGLVDGLDGDLDDHVTDTNNPHQVTFTQVALADSATSITAAEAETLRDGSNADALHIHSAGVITYNNTTSGLIATDVQDAIDELNTNISNFKMPQGTAFPTSPDDGDLFYRTDLNLSFQYDDSRSKWLSMTQMYLDWGAANANGRYLNIHGATATQTGYLMPRNGTIISLTARTSSGNQSKEIEIRKNNDSGSLLATFSLSGGSYSSSTINADFVAGDYLQAYATSEGAPARDLVVMATIAYRE